MKKDELYGMSSRREFFGKAGSSVAAMAMLPGLAPGGKTKFQSELEEKERTKIWMPISDRKVRVGIVGYGASKFGAAFGFQNHPNVEVVAVSDLFPDRCAALAKATNCKKTYPSLEELVKDDSIEAVWVATDAPSHPRHCIEVLKHGKHAAVAVPVTYGSIEQGEELLEVVKKNRGLKFMMFETSCMRANLYAMRKLYHAGAFGKVVYTEGEYYHGPPLFPPPDYKGIGSYKGWRNSGPPQVVLHAFECIPHRYHRRHIHRSELHRFSQRERSEKQSLQQSVQCRSGHVPHQRGGDVTYDEKQRNAGHA